MSATRLSERVRVVLAPNPGPMTLEGTNTYLVGDARDVIVIDPGPDDPAHLERLRAAVGDANVVGVLLTHWHADHAGAARRAAQLLDAPLGSWSPLEPGEIPLHHGERVGAAGVWLVALHTPGHASDHLCFMLEEERAVFTGDLVLGRGTSVIAYPDGDMAAYLESLRAIQALAPARLYPGHGPVVDEPAALIAEYLAHRLFRERQVLEALPGTPEELVARIYVDVDPRLHPVAAMSVRAHLAKLEREGRVVSDAQDRWRMREGFDA